VLTLKFCRHDYNSHLLAKNVKVQSFSEHHPKLCEDFGNAFATWVMDVQDVIDGNSLNVDEKPATPIIAIQKGEGEFHSYRLLLTVGGGTNFWRPSERSSGFISTSITVSYYSS